MFGIIELGILPHGLFVLRMILSINSEYVTLENERIGLFKIHELWSL